MTTAVVDKVECFGNIFVTIPEEIRHEPLSDAELDDMYSTMAEDMRCFRIMSPTDGDKRIIWNSRVLEERQAAKAMFMDLLSKGMRPFKVGIDGEASSEEMKVFDPTAEEVIFVAMAAVVGG